MKHFKLNSNKLVMSLHRELVLPGMGAKECQENIRSVCFREQDLQKLERMRAKYKISKSAIIRILLDGLEE